MEGLHPKYLLVTIRLIRKRARILFSTSLVPAVRGNIKTEKIFVL